MIKTQWLCLFLLMGIIPQIVFCFKYSSPLKFSFIVLETTRKEHIYGNRKQKKGFVLYKNNYGKEYVERTKKLKHLSDVLNIDPYPSTFEKRNIKLIELKKHYAYLKNGDVVKEPNYVVYGRIIIKRNNGMFLIIQDDEETLQIYVPKNVVIEEETNKKKKDNNFENDSEYDNSLVTGETKKLERESIFNKKNEHLSNDYSNESNHVNSVRVQKIVEVGDFVCIKGFMRKTLKGEVTLEAKNVTLLAKALLPLPDKYKGMKDIEYIHRKKYLLYLTNKKEKEKIMTRFRLVQTVRKYLIKKKYIEVDTPILQLIPGGATAKPFETFLKALNLHLYLRIAPELFLKKLIISGISEQIFELSKCFRNEGFSTLHNPEFTMLEIYKAFSNYKYMMKFTEKLIKYIAKKLNAQANCCILQKKWKKISFINILKKYTSVDFLKLSFNEAYEKALQLNVKFEKNKINLNWGIIVEEVFKKKVEPHLTMEPLHIFHFPSDTSPLAKTLRTNQKLAERFETYIGKMEIANGYSEEANPLVQEQKFLAQYMLSRKFCDDGKPNVLKETKELSNLILNGNYKGDDILKKKIQSQTKMNESNIKSIDYDYLTSLCHGLPPTGGLGIGIDRLCMLFTNSTSIKNILPFPIIKLNQLY